MFISPANWGRSKALTPWSLTSPLKSYLKAVFQPPFIRDYVKLRVSPQGGSLNFCVVCTLVVSPRMLAKSAWQSRVVEKKGWFGDENPSYPTKLMIFMMHLTKKEGRHRKGRIVPVETFICSEIGLIWWWRIIIAYRLYPGFILAGQKTCQVSSGWATACQQRQTSNWKQRWNHRTSVVLFLPTINWSKIVPKSKRLGSSESETALFSVGGLITAPRANWNAYHVLYNEMLYE